MLIKSKDTVLDSKYQHVVEESSYGAELVVTKMATMEIIGLCYALYILHILVSVP